MPNPSNATYGYGIQESSSVQSLGGNYVQIQNSDVQFTVEMAMKTYMRNDEAKTDSGKSKDMWAAEVAGLGDYNFKNQAERRHVLSTWYKRLNPSYNDKLKARNLYDAENKPVYWPEDIEYCSPTNPKKHGKGKLDHEELTAILTNVKPVLLKMLHQEYQMLSPEDVEKLSQISIPQEVQSKISRMTSTERCKVRSLKQEVTKQETPAMVTQDSGHAVEPDRGYPVVHQESQTNQHDTRLLMPRQAQFGIESNHVESQMIVPLPPQPAMNTGDLGTLSLNSIYQQSGDGPNVFLVKSDAIQQASEVTVYTQNPDSPITANCTVPTMVEEINDQIEDKLFTDEQLEALTNCVNSRKNAKSGFDGFDGLLDMRTNNDIVPCGEESKIKVEYNEDKFIVNPEMLTSQTQIFDTSGTMYTCTQAMPSCGSDWNIPGYSGEQTNVFMDTGGEDTTQQAVELSLFSSVNQNHSCTVAQPTVGLFTESSEFELSLPTDEEMMEVENIAMKAENIAAEFPAQLYNIINGPEPASFTDMFDYM